MRTIARHVLVTFVVVLASAGCRDATEPHRIEVVLETDKDAYTATHLGGAEPWARYGFPIVVQLHNRGNVPVYLPQCSPDEPGPMRSVSLASGAVGERSAYGGGGLCTGYDNPIVIQPGESHTDQYTVAGPNLQTSTGEDLGVLTGRMVVFYLIQTCRDRDRCSGPDFVVSNEFTVTLAPAPD